MKAHEVIELLRARYSAPAWAFLEQVGNRTGAYTSRHADALAMGLYPSRGLEIIGFEVKVARNDWRRELINPEKAEEIASRCDRWYIVAPKDVVPVMELPTNWGLIEVHGDGKLYDVKPAARLEPKPLDRSFLAAILRQASKTSPTLEMQADARRKADAEANELLDSRVELRTQELRIELERLRERVQKFEETTGIPLEQQAGQSYYGFPSGNELARAVLYIAQRGPRGLQWEIDQIERVSRRLAEIAGEARAAVTDDEEAPSA